MEKTREQKIKDFKKANLERRQKIVEKYGFKTSEEYIKFLEKGVKVKKSTKKDVIVSKMKGVFYIVDLLDATGSMGNNIGGKYDNSKSGIISSIKDMAVRKDVKYTFVEFIERSRPLNYAIIDGNPSEINTDNIKFSGAIGGDTPLYWAVWSVISSLSDKVTKDDKVLIKVYTDGGNNSMIEYTSKAAELIEKVQKENFTVTFVATPRDLEMIKRQIN